MSGFPATLPTPDEFGVIEDNIGAVLSDLDACRARMEAIAEARDDDGMMESLGVSFGAAPTLHDGDVLRILVWTTSLVDDAETLRADAETIRRQLLRLYYETRIDERTDADYQTWRRRRIDHLEREADRYRKAGAGDAG